MKTFGIACLCLAALLQFTMASAATSAQDSTPSADTEAQTMTRDEVTRIIDNTRKIVSPNGVDERIKLRIGGIDQWVSIRGRDRRNRRPASASTPG